MKSSGMSSPPVVGKGGTANINDGVLERAAAAPKHVAKGALQGGVALGDTSGHAGAGASKLGSNNRDISATGNLNGPSLGFALAAEVRVGLSHWVVVVVGHD